MGSGFGRLVVMGIACVAMLGIAVPDAAARVKRDRTKPTTPRAVRAVGTSTTQIVVTWKPARDNVGVRSYLVYRAGRRVPIAIVRGNVRRVRDRLAPSTSVRRYVVRARDASGNLSRPSVVARGRTIAPAAPRIDQVTGGGPDVVEPVSPTLPTSLPVFGYSTHVARQADPDAYLDLAVRGGAAAIRDDVEWADVEPEAGVFDWRATDAMMRGASQRGLRVLLMVGTTPTWASAPGAARWVPPVDSAHYAAFVADVAARYREGGTFWRAHPQLAHTPLLGIQVWNEPNLDRFWRTGPDPARYARMLRAAHAAVKSADARIPVISGGLGPLGAMRDVDCDGVADSGVNASGWNPLDYLAALYANGASGSFDALGWQPYEFGANATADAMTATSPCSAWTQMSETPTSARSLMTTHGDGAKRIWATELGAPTCIAGATYVCTADSEIAVLAERRVATWRTLPWAGGFFWYDIRDDDGGDSTSDHEEHFGAVEANGTAKLTYAALLRAWSVD